MGAVWRLWTRFTRWREARFGDPKTDGWTTDAIKEELAREAAQAERTGRHHQRRTS